MRASTHESKHAWEQASIEASALHCGHDVPIYTQAYVKGLVGGQDDVAAAMLVLATYSTERQL